MKRTGFVRTIGWSGMLICATTGVHAGTFLDFNLNDPTLIVHPTGYLGTGGQLNVSVCLDHTALPTSGDPSQAIRNAVAEFNRMQGLTGNVTNVSAGNDFESVLLHELGHCIGMDHSALGPSETCDATENSFDSPSIYFANSFGSAGPDVAACGGVTTVYSTDDGADNVRGTRDDVRGTNINRNWFRKQVNNPFEAPPATVDRQTYAVSLTGNLPMGHTYPEIATSFGPCNSGQPNSSGLRSQDPTQNTMFPVICSNNTLRKLAPDDVVTLRIARSGLDGVQSTADDYTLQLNYTGTTTAESPNCNIKVRFAAGAGFAFCSTGASSINSSNIRITSAQAVFEQSISWFFNQNDTATSNIGPTISANTPAHNSTTAMSGGVQGAQVTSNITFNVSGGSGTGTTDLVCSVNSGTVAINSGASQLNIPVGGSTSAVVARFTLTASTQSGQIRCSATPDGGSVANFTYNFTAPAGTPPVTCDGDLILRSGFEDSGDIACP